MANQVRGHQARGHWASSAAVALQWPGVHYEGLPTKVGSGSCSILFGFELPTLGGFGRNRNCSTCRCHVTFELQHEIARCAALANEAGPQTNRSTDCTPAADKLLSVARSHPPTSTEPCFAPSGSSPPLGPLRTLRSLSRMQLRDGSPFM